MKTYYIPANLKRCPDNEQLNSKLTEISEDFEIKARYEQRIFNYDNHEWFGRIIVQSPVKIGKPLDKILVEKFSDISQVETLYNQLIKEE